MGVRPSAAVAFRWCLLYSESMEGVKTQKTKSKEKRGEWHGKKKQPLHRGVTSSSRSPPRHVTSSTSVRREGYLPQPRTKIKAQAKRENKSNGVASTIALLSHRWPERSIWFGCTTRRNPTKRKSRESGSYKAAHKKLTYVGLEKEKLRRRGVANRNTQHLPI